MADQYKHGIGTYKQIGKRMHRLLALVHELGGNARTVERRKKVCVPIAPNHHKPL